MIGFRHDWDDGKYVDLAEGRQIWPAEQGGADADEILAFVGVFGDFKGDGLYAGYDFGGGEGISGNY